MALSNTAFVASQSLVFLFKFKIVLHDIQVRMTAAQYTQTLAKYMNAQAAEFITSLYYSETQLRLTITKSRKTKLGDYRPKQARNPVHKITVNYDLPDWEMVVTLLHEFAHYLVFLSHKNKVQAHGKEWRDTFRMLMKQAYQAKAFDSDMWPQLYELFFTHDNIARANYRRKTNTQTQPNPNIKTVADVPQGYYFLLNHKWYERGEKLRVNYRCRNLSNNELYLVRSYAEVQQISKPENIPTKTIKK